ncbi:hypothetical protein, partial [Klebsiella pneumoniae]|uniref:hypothetical protein n=1 Tax=Klebsiella pneumoniae TaxID=573 RepID=UPI003013BD28
EGGSEEEEEDLGTSEESGGAGGQKEGQVEGMKKLARAIERFGEIRDKGYGEILDTLPCSLE